MKILLLGEASFFHFMLRDGLRALGHDVTLMSDGNAWHDAPRDVDLRRNPRWGKLGGLMVVARLLRHWRLLMGNDVVQLHNYYSIPLKARYNTWLLPLLKRWNKTLVKCCLGDDVQVLGRQLEGVPRYNDMYWAGRPQHEQEHSARMAEEHLPQHVTAWQRSTATADALVTCLYEYWLAYNEEPYRQKLHYIGLPMMIPEGEAAVKGRQWPIKVVVGVQRDRDYMKGALRIKAWVDEVARRHPGKVEVVVAENMPLEAYEQLLLEADVQVDQLYSFSPSMNSLMAMARGTVVIGGGEEDYYRFIGEPELRPIINVSPEKSDADNIATLETALLEEGHVSELSRQSVAFVKKYHDHKAIARQYASLYMELLSRRR